MRAAWRIGVVYLAVAVLLCGVKPLWLDEILQLIDTRGAGVWAMILRLPAHHAGSAPLGYVVQNLTLKITGYSELAARIPAAIFGAATVILVALLSASLGRAASWKAALIYALFPLTLRYSAEGRMYSQALFFATLATLLYVRHARKPALSAALSYRLALIAAAYTQPFSASVGLALFLWSATQRQWHSARFGAVSFLLTIAVFLPWHWWSHKIFAVAAAERMPVFAMSITTPLMIFRELAGLGYWGSALLLFLCLSAIRRRLWSGEIQSLLLLLIAIPILCVLAADAWFGYFIAARQFLWVLPAIAILASAGLEKRNAIVVALLAAVALRQNVAFFRKPAEDWHAAATRLLAEADRGACILVVPSEQVRLYGFFYPRILDSHCPSAATVLVSTPYTGANERESAIRSLASNGCTFRKTESAGKSEIQFFHCGST